MSKTAKPATIVELESDLIVQDPEALKQTLLAALTSGNSVVVRAAKVSRVGTAALQLLLAFVHEARHKGLAVDWRDASSALRDAVAVAGLATELEVQPKVKRRPGAARA